jgi:GTP-binding protein
MDNVSEETALKQGELLFRRECDFATAASIDSSLPPPTVSEIAFAGRSNVGKSSLINALTGRKGLARASNTPGRTQQINFFDLGGILYLTDLPGYGYAVASKEKVHAWNEMVRSYLRTRSTLKRVCVLIDSRHGLKDIDIETMGMLDKANVPYVIVLTKTDKPKAVELAAVVAATEVELKNHPCALPQPYSTSAGKKTGIAELRALLATGLRL